MTGLTVTLALPVLELASVAVMVTVSDKLSKVLMMNVPPERVIGLPVNCTLAELALRVTKVELSVVTVLLFTSWAVTVTLNAVPRVAVAALTE